MEISDFGAGRRCWVVGLRFSSPPRYACFREEHPSGWMWTSELTEAETFRTKEQAEAHIRGDMAELIDGNEDVKILEVEMKVGEAR